MLVLSRKEGEKISVGDNIEITICRISGGRVKVGLRAPKGVRILRGEIAAEEGNCEPIFELESVPLDLYSTAREYAIK